MLNRCVTRQRHLRIKSVSRSRPRRGRTTPSLLLFDPAGVGIERDSVTDGGTPPPVKHGWTALPSLNIIPLLPYLSICLIKMNTCIPSARVKLVSCSNALTYPTEFSRMISMISTSESLPTFSEVWIIISCEIVEPFK